ncbi:death effector domain-containing protein-like [Limulus polyphemus]|uniref:Death effector domain-containing protein-like n=1 Tax=Limulus polyphemus TaxID=6850 RepID=A0ABM1BMT1_LIMPO|nr:death effector domain-containing protein-like [Limulus polyphemus]XP_022253398.1 death effector domain-containing protein-like [Limulus polyphemus]
MANAIREWFQGVDKKVLNFRWKRLFNILHRFGVHLTIAEIKLLIYLTGNAIDETTKLRIKNGKDLILALVKCGACDENNFRSIIHLLKCINRYDLLHLVSVKSKRKVLPDPVEHYLLHSSQLKSINDQVSRPTSCLSSSFTTEREPSTTLETRVERSQNRDDIDSPVKKLRRSPRYQKTKESHKPELDDQTDFPSGARIKYTSDVRLRVRAEYCNYENALQGAISSNKADLIERQLECFSQANTILRSRDLGDIVCNIRFSEITYLDAFWRDYLNGALLDALKGVFITDSLKQAVGNEAIKLLVNVDEEDYERGRRTLLQNL